MNRLIDTHVHLTHERYEEENYNPLDSIILNKDIISVVDIGCDKDSIDKTIELSRKYEKIYSAIGIHPVDYLELDENVYNKIKKKASSNQKIVAIGEIGLDYYWLPEKKEEQKMVFEKQLNLAEELNLPVIIHCRDAYDDCLAILQTRKTIRGVIHSFSKDYEVAKKFIELGLYIGISGPVTFKNGEDQKDVIKKIDLDKLVIETDSPFLTPVPFRGKLNKPEYVEYVFKEIMKLRNEPEEKIENQLLQNSIKLFDRMDDGKI